MKKPSKKNRQRADVIEESTLYETKKSQDEKTKRAMAYGHRKPFSMTMHDESVGADDSQKDA